MAFWRRKNKDQYITLGLNEPLPAKEKEQEQATTDRLEPPAAATPHAGTTTPAPMPTLEPVITGDQPTPPPARESHAVTESTRTPRPQTRGASSSEREPVKPASQQKHVPSRSPFQTSVLGLNLTMEELQAQEAALEQEFSARFRRAISATRESLSETIDTVFQSRRKIDAALLDELEEALIAADIGVPTTLHILDTVRRGIARNQINDID
ncbi:MAG: signal recognition particle receptor subunit alpha, partial [Acidobacteriota bacterium]|nr:signal recognition particle receptor subunit alpha [Acidobacteriota bacterium]